jgi:RNA polymerase sigma-70 factor (ECF subfamily)
MDDPADQPLLERARAGDAAALARLLEKYQPQIYRFGLRMCRDPEDARDVLQDTLFALARGVREFRGDAALSTWLFTVARSFCAKKRRRREGVPGDAQLLHTAAAQAVAPGVAADQALASKELEHALDQAIRALEPKYREVLLLRDVEGLTAPEVAKVTGLGVRAVKSRLHRARLAVRQQLGPLLEEPRSVPEGRVDCPDVLGLFSRHLEGEISADVCVEMERHLEGCARCRRTCDSLKRTLTLCRAVGPSVQVPVEVQASVRFALRDFLSEGA